jgi:hypothetical protein
MKKLMLVIGLCLASFGGLQPNVEARIGYRGCTPFWGNATVSRFQDGSMWELRCNYGGTSISAYQLRNDTWVYIGGGFFPSSTSVVYVPWTPLPMKVILHNNGCTKEVRF